MKFVVGGLLALFALAWCTSSAQADGSRAVQLFPQAIAEKIAGVSVKPNFRNSEDDIVIGKTWVSKAGYQLDLTPKDPTSGKPFLNILLRHAGTREEALNVFAQSKDEYKGADVAGFDVPAYRTVMPPQLNILKGKNWLIITAGTRTSPDIKMQETTAKELIPRMVEQ